MRHVRALSVVSVAPRLQSGGMTRTTCSAYRSSAVLAALLFILSASSAFAQGPQGAAICVDVDVRFTERHPADVFITSLQNETASIWERYGVRLAWPRATSSEGCAPPQASFVVLVNYEHAQTGSAWMNELGSTRVIPGVIDHAPICVNRETTERVLWTMTPVQLTRALNRTAVNSADVGRAVGRVLAHELGHVLLAEGDHQTHGLMRRSFPSEDLVRPQSETFTLSAGEVDRLRERFFSGVMPTYRAPLASLRCGERVIGD
jgi:hypothetical protein